MTHDEADRVMSDAEASVYEGRTMPPAWVPVDALRLWSYARADEVMRVSMRQLRAEEAERCRS